MNRERDTYNVEETPKRQRPSLSMDGETALVQRCRQGHGDAYETLYRHFASRLHGHLRVLLGPTADVEDALQQTFIEAFRNMDRFEGRSRLSSWLHGIAVRVALNSMRARRRRDQAMSTLAAQAHRRPTGPTPEKNAVARQQVLRLEQHLQRVSPPKRLAFVLYYVEQLTLAEVAERIGCKPEAAWKRIARARTEVLRSVERLQRAEERRGGHE